MRYLAFPKLFKRIKKVHNSSLAEIWRPSTQKEALIYDTMLIVGASVFISLFAQIKIPVPFSPVPITGQSFAVLFVAVLLGKRRGSLAVAAYLFEGAIGLPVFAGASFGFAHLLGPTGGYLLGFLPAAFICGFLAEKGMDKSFYSAFLLMFLGTAIIFVFGLLRLAQFTGTEKVLELGFYPFLYGAFVKIILATFLIPAGWKFLQIRRNKE